MDPLFFNFHGGWWGGLLSNSRGVGGICSKGPVEHFLEFTISWKICNMGHVGFHCHQFPLIWLDVSFEEACHLNDNGSIFVTAGNTGGSLAKARLSYHIEILLSSNSLNPRNSKQDHWTDPPPEPLKKIKKLPRTAPWLDLLSDPPTNVLCASLADH